MLSAQMSVLSGELAAAVVLGFARPVRPGKPPAPQCSRPVRTATTIPRVAVSAGSLVLGWGRTWLARFGTCHPPAPQPPARRDAEPGTRDEGCTHVARKNVRALTGLFFNEAMKPRITRMTRMQESEQSWPYPRLKFAYAPPHNYGRRDDQNLSECHADSDGLH